LLALTELGYRNRAGAWRHSDPNRRVVFLGDFIDRGPENAAVLDTVRRMLDAGAATAVMGNHELNAINFHTSDPMSGRPLRSHSRKNLNQHRSFLHEFPLGSPQALEAINWMKALPLFLEYPEFRIVHACWLESGIETLKASTLEGVLSEEQFLRMSAKEDPLRQLVETVTKGPEISLPDGIRLADKDGHLRSEVRLRWWARDPKTWGDLSISVPNENDLPLSMPPGDLLGDFYPLGALPVFVGHYWLTGAPVLQASNIMCLDYSAGTVGPLVSYQFEDGQVGLSIDRVTVHR
jgi:hypothetical protein